MKDGRKPPDKPDKTEKAKKEAAYKTRKSPFSRSRPKVRTKADAIKRTDDLRNSMRDNRNDVSCALYEAKLDKVWKLMGYKSFRKYLIAEFGGIMSPKTAYNHANIYGVILKLVEMGYDIDTDIPYDIVKPMIPHIDDPNLLEKIWSQSTKRTKGKYPKLDQIEEACQSVDTDDDDSDWTLLSDDDDSDAESEGDDYDELFNDDDDDNHPSAFAQSRLPSTKSRGNEPHMPHSKSASLPPMRLVRLQTDIPDDIEDKLLSASCDYDQFNALSWLIDGIFDLTKTGKPCKPVIDLFSDIGEVLGELDHFDLGDYTQREMHEQIIKDIMNGEFLEIWYELYVNSDEYRALQKRRKERELDLDFEEDEVE